VNPAVTRLARNYAPAFLAYLASGGELRLRAAYELGRSALADGVSVLDLVTAHHEVLGGVLRTSTSDEDLTGTMASAAAFLVEALASYDMAERMFQEAVRAEREAPR
jgi:hypothetical protein